MADNNKDIERYAIKEIKITGETTDEQVKNLRATYGGQTFGDGLYRVLKEEDVPKVKNFFDTTFGVALPKYIGAFDPFAIDWLGNILGVDQLNDACSDLSGEVSLYEVEMGELMPTPFTLKEYHEEYIGEEPEEALVADFYIEWLKANGKKPGYNECIGYKFEDGQYELSNLQFYTIEKYLQHVNEDFYYL